MTWQKKARIAIALFVVAFVVVVALALRRGKGTMPQDAAVPPRQAPDAPFENTGGGSLERRSGEKVTFSIKFKTQIVQKDGRSKLTGVEAVLPDRGGRAFRIKSDEADIEPSEQGVKTGKFTGNVTLTTDDGLEVKTKEASYNEGEGVTTIPGPVTFARGRMTGKSIGATYDLNREVLWMLEQARVDVRPDKQGNGALEATAKAIGVARTAHYVQLNGDAHVNAEGRVLRSNDMTINLTEDNERVQLLQLRGNARIDGGGRGGPQQMSANDIDLTYGEDGRSLQFAKLVQNAFVQLPGVGKAQGRRVAASAIDIALAPDGNTVTNLTANEKVQLDIPADGDTAARRIRSDSLMAAGTPEGGLQEATFTGNIDFRETRAARGKLAAVNRTARSLRLIVKTQPGLGAIQQADFYGNVHFTDGTTARADSPFAAYKVAEDRLDLSPMPNEPGNGPIVVDGKVEVQARTIEFGLTTRSMKADTRVRSTLSPEKGKGANGQAGDSKVPALLKSDEVVTVTSNRMEYDGTASRATYSGNAALWQTDTNIYADTIVLDDKTGNLTAKEKVQTKMLVEHSDSKTKERKTMPQTGRAQLFEYTDAKRVAVYTTDAFLSGPNGDITGDKIELFLKAKVNELDRAEAYGKVTMKEGLRSGTGLRLTYTTDDDKYVMTGTPVEVTEKTPPNCSVMTGATFTYMRATDQSKMTGDGAHPQQSKKIPCGGQP